MSDWDDQLLLAEVFDECSCNGSADFELFNKSGSCDAKDFGYFLGHSFELLLVEEDGVVKLFLYLGLGPRLLLSFSTAFASSLCLRRLSVFGRILTCILRTCLLLLSHSSY